MVFLFIDLMIINITGQLLGFPPIIQVLLTIYFALGWKFVFQTNQYVKPNNILAAIQQIPVIFLFPLIDSKNDSK
jgi:hypothetical protein